MKKLSDIFKFNTSHSFLIQGRQWGKTHTPNQIKSMENYSAQDYFKMIENGEFPSFLNSKDRERISELFKSGEQWSAVRKLQTIIESNGGKPRSFA